MTPYEREVVDVFVRWAQTALRDGAYPVGLILLSSPNADGDRLPAVYSLPDDRGCRDLLTLLQEIVEQVDAGLSTEVHLGEEAPRWFREGRPPTPEELRLRPDPWGGGESPPDRPPTA